jgi:hypothetical protein
MEKKTFYFNTGVNPYNFNPPIQPSKGQVVRGGTIQIPFVCEVPEGAVFKFAANSREADVTKSLFMAEILEGRLLSKYAFFKLP